MLDLVEFVSRFILLKKNGGECIGKCAFHADDAESLRVGLTAWRCLACSEQEVTSGDAVGFYMSWTGCDRAQAEQELAEGTLPEPMAIQQAEVRRVFFWTVKALIDNPAPLVWIHWQAESVHFGREHMAEGRVHLGLCPGRPIDDDSIKRLKGRSCILIPDNRESSFERMDELAQKLYAAGHAKVRYVKVAEQEDCWAWPMGLTREQALTFVQEHVLTYPNNGATQETSSGQSTLGRSPPMPSESDPAGAPPFNALPSGISPAVSAPGPQGGAPINVLAPGERKPGEIIAPRNDAARHGVGNQEPVSNPVEATLNAAPTPAHAVASGHHPLVAPPIDTAGVGDAPNIAPDRSGSPPGAHPDDPGPVAPPGTPKARKSPPDLAVVDDTGAVRKPRLEITVDPDQLPAFSEFALAKAFADGPGVDWRYTAAWGLWAKWNGTRWVQDDRKGITWETKNCCSAVMHDHLPDSTPAQRMKVGTLRTVNSVIGLAGSDPRIAMTADAWDADPYLLGTPAGIVDLRTGIITPAFKEQLISKSTCIAPASGEHPWWDCVLRRPQDGAMVDFLQLWCGYALTGDTREERFLFIHGPGGGGKSKFLAVLSEILGDYRRTAPMDAFTVRQHHEHSEEIARLAGARLVVATETDEGSRWNEARIKQLTGRDLITARHMRMSSFEFPPQFKLVFIGNHKPALRSVGEEMRRRIDLVDWGGTIPEAERILDLPEKLRAEYPAILAWMIEGCLKWQSQGLGKPPEVEASVADYIQGEDTLGAWMDECVELRAGDRVKSGDAYHSFRRWAEAAGEFVPSQKRFTQRLRDRGIGTIKSGERYFQGMRLKVTSAEVRETVGWVPD